MAAISAGLARQLFAILSKLPPAGPPDCWLSPECFPIPIQAEGISLVCLRVWPQGGHFSKVGMDVLQGGQGGAVQAGAITAMHPCFLLLALYGCRAWHGPSATTPRLQLQQLLTLWPMGLATATALRQEQPSMRDMPSARPGTCAVRLPPQPSQVSAQLAWMHGAHRSVHTRRKRPAPAAGCQAVLPWQPADRALPCWLHTPSRRRRGLSTQLP